MTIVAKKGRCEYCGREEQPNAHSVLDLYNELLYAVETKIPGETRHETALRYIMEAQKSSDAPAKET